MTPPSLDQTKAGAGQPDQHVTTYTYDGSGLKTTAAFTEDTPANGSTPATPIPSTGSGGVQGFSYYPNGLTQTPDRTRQRHDTGTDHRHLRRRR